MSSLRRQFFFVLSAATCIALLVGCAGPSTPTIEVESPVATPESQRETFDSPQPTPTPILSPTAASALPAPSSSDVATVGGVFMRDLGDGESEPGAGTKLQLARVIRSEDGTPLVASAGDKSSPTTETKEDGFFVFQDVPPNTYVLVVVTPVGSFMIKDDSGEDFFIEAESGEVVDVGEVHTDLPY